MEDALYEVLITGRIAGHVSREQAIAAFASLFCLSPDEAALRFGQAPFVARGRLNRDQAEKYCRVIRRQGIDCELHQALPSPTLYPRLTLGER